MRLACIGVFASVLLLCGASSEVQSTEDISRAVGTANTIQFNLAVERKRLAVLSREMTETDRCAANQLLSAATIFWEVTEEARKMGAVVGEMKSVDDEKIIRKHFGYSARLVVSIGEGNIKHVSDLLSGISTSEAKAVATGIRDKMIQVRDLLEPFASHRP